MAGDTLYCGPADIILRLDANTGAELARRGIQPPSVRGLAADITEARLYAFLSGGSGAALMVLDRSLQTVATLAVPPGTAFETIFCDGVSVVPDVSHLKAYAMNCAGEVLTFDLLNQGPGLVRSVPSLTLHAETGRPPRP